MPPAALLAGADADKAINLGQVPSLPMRTYRILTDPAHKNDKIFKKNEVQ